MPTITEQNRSLVPERVAAHSSSEKLARHESVLRASSQWSPSPIKNCSDVRSRTMYDVSVVTLTRTDTTLDHSQKAEKVCRRSGPPGAKMGWSRCPVPPSSPLHTPPDPAPPGDKEGRARGERAGGKREAGGHDVGERRALAAARKQAAS